MINKSCLSWQESIGNSLVEIQVKKFEIVIEGENNWNLKHKFDESLMLSEVDFSFLNMFPIFEELQDIIYYVPDNLFIVDKNYTDKEL